MKRTLLAALAMSMFAGCAGMQIAPAETEPSPSQTTSQEGPSLLARAGTLLERFLGQPAPQLQGDEVNATAATRGEEFSRERAKALAGDRDAMFRVAQMFRRGSHGLPRDEVKMVSWLRQASDLGHGAASYQLYQHYLYRGLDRQAVHYENLAVRQGYTIPARQSVSRNLLL